MTGAAGPLILIADDDEDILELIRLRLSRSGYWTLLARDGLEALTAARARRPDVAVLDVTMPGLNGYEVVEELRRDPRTSDIPIILLTGRAEAGDVARGFEAGSDDYVTKPFSPQELENRVSAALERSAARDSAGLPSIRPATEA
jgi:DNA-binding response OmpR family regulator